MGKKQSSSSLWHPRRRSASAPATPRAADPPLGCMSMVHYLIFAPGGGCVGRPPTSASAVAMNCQQNKQASRGGVKRGGFEAPRNSLDLDADSLDDIPIGVQIEPAFDALACRKMRSKATAPSSEAETPRTPSLLARLMGIDGLPESSNSSPSPALVTKKKRASQASSASEEEKKKRVIPESVTSSSRREPLRSLSCNVESLKENTSPTSASSRTKRVNPPPPQRKQQSIPSDNSDKENVRKHKSPPQRARPPPTTKRAPPPPQRPRGPDGCERFATRIKKPSAAATSSSPVTPPRSGSSRGHVVEDPGYGYLRKVLERGGFLARSGRPFKARSVLDPIVFHLLELELPADARLRHRCNRKLFFHLAQEILADLILVSSSPPGGIAASAAHHKSPSPEELLSRVWNRVRSFPGADCRVVGDIDALVAMDLHSPAAVRRLGQHPAVLQEAADVAEDVADQVLDTLLQECCTEDPAG